MGECQETGEMEAVLAVLEEINSRRRNLEARQSMLEQRHSKVEKMQQGFLQLFKQRLEGS